jgi:hypothetical protein
MDGSVRVPGTRSRGLPAGVTWECYLTRRCVPESTAMMRATTGMNKAKRMAANLVDSSEVP